MISRAVVLVIIGVLFGFLPSPRVEATQGIALDPGQIDVTEPLRRGVDYVLPPLSVRNPGTEAGRYQMVVNPVNPTGDRRLVSPEWIVFDVEQFDLGPGESIRVGAVLQLPADLEPGEFHGLIGARVLGTAPEGAASAAIGAAAAATLTFEVASEGLVQTLWQQLSTWLDRNQPWLSILVALVVVLSVLITIGRRFRFRVERR